MRLTFLIAMSLMSAACNVAALPDRVDSHDTVETTSKDTSVVDSAVPDTTSAADTEDAIEDVADVADIDESARSWRVAMTPIPEDILGIWGSDPTDVWAVGAGGLALSGSPGGWRQLDLRAVDGSGAALRGVHGDGDYVWLVGDGGRAYRWNRMQGLAETITTGTTLPLNAVWSSSDGIAWAVGGPLSPASGSPIIVRIDGLAGTLQTLPAGLPTDAALHAVWGTSATDVWAAGESGMLLHFDGVEWTDAALAGAPLLRGVFGHAGEVIAVGGEGTAELWTRADSATTFERVELSSSVPLNGVAIGDDGAAWAVGSLGGMFERAAGGVTWEARTPIAGAYWSAVWIDSRGDVWAAGPGIVRLGPARADIPSGALVRVDEPVVEEEPDVEVVEDVDVVETVDAIESDTSVIPRPWGFDLGSAEPTNPVNFTPWQNDQIVLINHGPQGGFHLELYVRFPMAGGQTEIATNIQLDLYVDGAKVGHFPPPGYPELSTVPAVSDGIYQTYPLTLAWDCSLTFSCDSATYDGHTAIVVASVAPPGQSWTGSLRVVLDDTW